MSKGGLSSTEIGHVCVFSDPGSGASDILDIWEGKLTVKDSYDITGSPMETGVMTFDNKVRKPQTVVVEAIVKSDEWSSVKRKVSRMMSNRDFEFYSVSGKIDYYVNLALTDAKWDASDDKYDAVDLELEFQEVIIETGSSSYADGDTKHMGVVG